MNKEKEFTTLEKRFGGYKFYRIREDGVYGQIFYPELVEEDEDYEYEGKFDDLSPGLRLEYLGPLEEYNRYIALRKEGRN